MFVLFFKQKTAYEMRISDWSSDVCSSDLRRIEMVGRVDRSLRDKEQRTEGGERRYGERGCTDVERHLRSPHDRCHPSINVHIKEGAPPRSGSPPRKIGRCHPAKHGPHRTRLREGKGWSVGVGIGGGSNNKKKKQ